MARRRAFDRVVWPGFNYKAATSHVLKVGRNDPCPCGSGKKYKDCHEPEGRAWLEKMAQEHERQRHRDARRQAHPDDLPWYRRLFRKS